MSTDIICLHLETSLNWFSACSVMTYVMHNPSWKYWYTSLQEYSRIDWLTSRAKLNSIAFCINCWRIIWSIKISWSIHTLSVRLARVGRESSRTCHHLEESLKLTLFPWSNNPWGHMKENSRRWTFTYLTISWSWLHSLREPCLSQVDAYLWQEGLELAERPQLSWLLICSTWASSLLISTESMEWKNSREISKSFFSKLVSRHKKCAF